MGSSHLAPPPKEIGEETNISSDGGGGGGGDDGGGAYVDGVDDRDDVMEWRAEVHAVGSSRPWALGVNRWGKDTKGKGGRKGRGKRRRRHTLGNTGGGGRKGEGSDSERDDAEFPFWALPDEDLPVVFNLKPSKAAAN